MLHLSAVHINQFSLSSNDDIQWLYSLVCAHDVIDEKLALRLTETVWMRQSYGIW